MNFENIAVAAAVALVVVLATDMTRPNGCRVFSKGPNGEDTLAFAPKKAV